MAPDGTATLKRKRNEPGENEVVVSVERPIPNFLEIVNITASKNSNTRLWVHRDVIIRSSPLMKAQLETGNNIVLDGQVRSPLDFARNLRQQLENFYVQWLYTQSIPSHDSPWSFEDWTTEYILSLYLRDVEYCNAIMDQMIMRGLRHGHGDVAYTSELAEFNISKTDELAEWTTDNNVFTMPEVFIADMLRKVVARLEDPESHQLPTMADREKYHLTTDTIEEARAAWIEGV